LTAQFLSLQLYIMLPRLRKIGWTARFEYGLAALTLNLTGP